MARVHHLWRRVFHLLKWRVRIARWRHVSEVEHAEQLLILRTRRILLTGRILGQRDVGDDSGAAYTNVHRLWSAIGELEMRLILSLVDVRNQIPAPRVRSRRGQRHREKHGRILVLVISLSLAAPTDLDDRFLHRGLWVAPICGAGRKVIKFSENRTEMTCDRARDASRLQRTAICDGRGIRRRVICGGDRAVYRPRCFTKWVDGGIHRLIRGDVARDISLKHDLEVRRSGATRRYREKPVPGLGGRGNDYVGRDARCEQRSINAIATAT